VVNALPATIGHTESLVYRVVKEAADACAAHTGGFCFQVKHLAHQPGFAQQLAVLGTVSRHA
jgi:hypothetical protein